MRLCVRCNNILQYTCNKTCDKCIAYIGHHLVCERCNRSYTRTNRNRHYRSYKCRVTIVIEF